MLGIFDLVIQNGRKFQFASLAIDFFGEAVLTRSILTASFSQHVLYIGPSLSPMALKEDCVLRKESEMRAIKTRRSALSLESAVWWSIARAIRASKHKRGGRSNWRRGPRKVIAERNKNWK